MGARRFVPDMTRDGGRRVLVLFDADCGFCTRTARILERLDRPRRLEIVPLQAVGGVEGMPSVEVLLDAMHVRDADGRWSLGGHAWIRIGEELPMLRPLALLARLPGMRRLIGAVYARVAGNRHRISRLLGDDACRVDQPRGTPGDTLSGWNNRPTTRRSSSTPIRRMRGRCRMR